MHLAGLSSPSRAQCHIVAVGVVAMAVVLLMLPSGTVSYRLNSLEDLKKLFDGADERPLVRKDQTWTRNLPLLLNLLKSIDDWETQRDTDSDADETGSEIRPSKRGRDMVYGAMPPMRELCRMMGYATCPH